MTALTIIGIIIGFLLFIGIGIYLWSVSMEKYDYNIFNTWVFLRGVVSYFALYFAAGKDIPKDDFFILLSLAGLMWAWTFIATLLRTNLIIALLSLLYQIIFVLIVKTIIERILKFFNN